ncbi:MAG: SGNH/GDSL hydrolase family protein [Thermomicrobiales bacterium]
MRFEHGQKILFIGDSITDCGRRDTNAPYGNGYMSLVRAFVDARYPELGLTWENRGIGGNTTEHLLARWEQDAIAEQPDWISVMIGINDVWRTFDSAGAGAVSIEEYEANLRALLQQVRDRTSARLIVADPFDIDPDRNDPMRAMMDAYGAVCSRVGAEFGAIPVHTQEAFDAVLESTSWETWAADKIHPGLPGHAVIAQAYLRAIGFELG